MHYNRRRFLKVFGATSILLGANTTLLKAFDGDSDFTKITILHTNDVHSRIEPFPMDGGRFQGLGGAARRASLISNIRKEEEHVVLLDSGDMFQGTPYFNYFGGELEMKLMTKMGYDVATIGNHDFDAGIDGLHKQMPHVNFSMVSSNYDFSNTVMNDIVKPYKIIERGGIKIGILGLGIELDGLVPKSLYKETQYLDPIEHANKTATFLKEEANCDLVICLSHLGYKYRNDKVSDVVLAERSENIDIILGGHTHTFLKEPTSMKNAKDEEVLISQVGWAGIILGRLDVYFEKGKKGKCVNCKNKTVS